MDIAKGSFMKTAADITGPDFSRKRTQGAKRQFIQPSALCHLSRLQFGLNRGNPLIIIKTIVIVLMKLQNTLKNGAINAYRFFPHVVP
jgi:hypothetical protein